MLISASSLSRAITCQASGILPRGPRIESPAAKRGTLIHSWIEAALRGKPLPDVGRHKVTVDMDALRAYLGDGEMRCELAMAWNPKSGVTDVLGEGIGRDYPEHAGIIGTADVAMLRPRAMVLDVKTGRRMGDVADNWQIRSLAVMLAGAYSVDSVTGVLAYLGRDGSWEFDAHTWNAFGLADLSDGLAAWAKRYRVAGELYADGWEPKVNPALETCRFCEALCSARYGAEEAA